MHRVIFFFFSIMTSMAILGSNLIQSGGLLQQNESVKPINWANSIITQSTVSKSNPLNNSNHTTTQKNLYNNFAFAPTAQHALNSSATTTSSYKTDDTQPSASTCSEVGCSNAQKDNPVTERPTITQPPEPIACTNSWPSQSCTYENPVEQPQITPEEPTVVACTNSWPTQSCVYDTL